MQVSPLRMVKFFHTGLVSSAIQGKTSVPSSVKSLDRLFHTLARYVGSESLDVSISLQFASKLLDGNMHASLLGHIPHGAGEGSSCCITFSNDNTSGVLGHVLSVLADKKVNVIDMMNKSRGELAFNIIDVENLPGDDVVTAIAAVEHVIRVRVI